MTAVAHDGTLLLGVSLKDLIFPVWDIPDFAGVLGDYEIN